MKKVSRLSLIATLALSSTMYANNISEAFDKLEVSGEVKAAYVDSNFLGGTKSDSVTAIGGSLSVKTGEFYGFKAGATFQTSSVLSDDVGNNAGTPLSVNNTSYRTNFFDASGSVLSEAYIEYAFKNTSVKAGRQFITTPLVSSGLEGKSSEAIIRDSFEAYTLTNTDIPNTTVVLGYVDKFQAQSDGSGNVGKFNSFQDGAYTIYAKNTSIENLTLQAQYLDVSGTTAATDKDALYFQADYQLGAQTISAQYLTTTDSSNDGELYGLRATGPLGLGKLGYLVAYTSSTDKNNAVYNGAGEGTTDTIFTALPVHDGGVPSRADNDTLVGALVAPIGPTTVIAYTGKSSSSTHALGDVTGTGVMFIYPIAKDLVLKANYEHVTVQAQPEDTDTTRVYLSYKF